MYVFVHCLLVNGILSRMQKGFQKCVFKLIYIYICLIFKYGATASCVCLVCKKKRRKHHCLIFFIAFNACIALHPSHHKQLFSFTGFFKYFVCETLFSFQFIDHFFLFTLTGTWNQANSNGFRKTNTGRSAKSLISKIYIVHPSALDLVLFASNRIFALAAIANKVCIRLDGLFRFICVNILCWSPLYIIFDVLTYCLNMLIF